MGYLKTLNHKDMPIALVLFSDEHNPQEFFYNREIEKAKENGVPEI